MKKKFLAVLALALTCAFVICGCGDGTETVVVPFENGGRQETVTDIEGNELSFTIYTIDGTVVYSKQNEYDKDKNLIRTDVYGMEEVLTQSYVYNYNAEGVMTSMMQYDGEGNLLFELPCDAEGNIIDGFQITQ